MSLDAISKSILSEAQGKASEMDSEADKEARRIVKEAEEKAKEIASTAQQDANREVERLVKESKAGAEMEANSMLLEAKGQAVEQELGKVLSGAHSEITKNNMKQLLQNGIKQFKGISGGNFTIKTSKKNSGLLDKTAYEVEYADMDGFVLYADHGKVALNATVDSVIDRQSDFARRLVSGELFGDAERQQAKPWPAPKKSAKPMKKMAKNRKRR